MSKSIEHYNPLWKSVFDELKRLLNQHLSILGDSYSIEHVGSTAVEGLCAKPILDVDIILYDKTLLNRISSILEHLGYVVKGEQGIDGRFAFRQSSSSTPLSSEHNQWQSHHLYVCYHDSLALKNHLLFRDALRSNNHLVEEYAALKKTLSNSFFKTNHDYQTQKTDFILSVLKSAGLDKLSLEAIKKANS